MPVNNKFGVLLVKKGEKKKQAIPLLEVSKQTGIARRTLYAWQKNVVDRFDTSIIEALCNYFGVSLSDLLEYVPPEHPPAPKKKN